MTMTVSMHGLASAHATVTPSPGSGYVGVTFASPDGSVSLHGEPAVVRQLLTDAVAQIDAIAAQRPDDGA